MFNFLKFTVMMIFIGIILIFLGIAVYIKGGTRHKYTDWLRTLGSLLIMAGGFIIGNYNK